MNICVTAEKGLEEIKGQISPYWVFCPAPGNPLGILSWGKWKYLQPLLQVSPPVISRPLTGVIYVLDEIEKKTEVWIQSKQV